MSSELDRIRAITNYEPAPKAAPAPPMLCPACGQETRPDGSCQNEECENFEPAE